MKVEIWSDVMCPFCYIGKRRFEQALAQFPSKDKIAVEWKSFQLDGTLQGVVSKEAYFAKKGFPMDRVNAMQQQMKTMAVADGIEMNNEKTIISNTYKAHQLIQLAKTLGKGNEAEEVFFYMYFTEGYNMDEEATIYEAANRLDISKEQVAALLANDTMKPAFEKDLMEAQQFGISGVPFFIFDRKYAVSGAQSVEHFLGALTQSFKEWQAKQPSGIVDLGFDEGASCDIDGNCK